ncbi:hypothetical protein DSO57_1034525 [Entomophthora muscae]|uniref:Uncharacterized protein n=1 Tax=Entomophthora muscae TaxID=34485 RepID=A0ACC2S1Y7_9FUNG|nr:hypothetical protein DSO57_1034525 [Entomophthora muscae]
MRIKSVSLVRRLEFQFKGNLHPNAIALGDVDHDQLSELVVGTLSGCLYIYKSISDLNNNSTPMGTSIPPWRTCSGLGTITSVVIGDIRNIGRNSIICINAEGGCYMFDYPFINYLNDGPSNAATPLLTPTFSNLPNAAAISLTSNEDGAASPNPPQPLGFSAQSSLIARANWATLVPTNTSVAMIGDIDGDGLNELVLGRTDRKIHAYQLSSHVALPTSSNRSSKTQAGRTRVGFDYQKLVWINTSEWQVAQPIASLSLASCSGTPLLVVGQDDGAYLCISSQGIIHPSTVPSSPSYGIATPAFAIPFEAGDRSVVVSVHNGLVLERVSSRSSEREQLAKILVSPSSRVVGFGEVPALQADITSPTGVVGWADGTTLLFNSLVLACTRFQFPHAPVAAFISGMFALSGSDVPCLFYVGFKGSIYGYSDPSALSCQATSQLVPFLSSDLEPYTQVIENISQLISAPPSKPPEKIKKRKKKKTHLQTSAKLPTLSEDERLALVYRYILYTALPLAARPHSLPSTTADAPPKVPLSELIGKISLNEDIPPIQPQTTTPKLPVPAISLARRASTLHTSLRHHPTQNSVASSPSTEPAVPVVTPSSASPSIYPSNSCVEDLERLKDYPLGFNNR